MSNATSISASVVRPIISGPSGQACSAPTARRAPAPQRVANEAVVRSEDLLRGRRAIDIVHGEARYRLSVTSLGKLILTK